MGCVYVLSIELHIREGSCINILGEYMSNNCIGTNDHDPYNVMTSC